MEKQKVDIVSLLGILRKDLGEDGGTLGMRYLDALSAWMRARIQRTVCALRGELVVEDTAEWTVLDKVAAEIELRCPNAARHVHRPGDRSDAAVRSLVEAFLL